MAVFVLSLARAVGIVVGCLVMSACSGRSNSGDAAPGTAGQSGGGGASTQASSAEGPDVFNGTAGESSITIGIKDPSCKTACAPGDCGPINNGCGSIIECGGCTAPEICGGAGVPSRCGNPLASCTPATCASLGANCGQQSDGCGGILDCWSAAAKAAGPIPTCEVPGALCIDGTCKSAAPPCTKRTCTDYAGIADLCGPVSDGCGGTLDCGLTCSADKVCGAFELGKCAKVVCTPMSCDEALLQKPAGFCGKVPDGCGGIVPDCGGGCAVAGESCGGGGEPDVCGKGAPVCVPLTTAECGNTCGQISDGCGGTVQCTTCQFPETCGGGGIRSRCGKIVCKARTCASAGATCGTIPDGCGNDLDCGTCTAPLRCGGGGLPNKCGGAVCVPKTQAQVCLPGICGQQSDGCEGTVECGGCTAPNTCGGGGTPNVCGAPACKKRTCAEAGANCGPISDGCNGIIPSCGTCNAPDVCGAVYPSVCGAGVDPNCTGLCQKIDRTCSSGSETRLTGKVRTPNGTYPVYNALVYVPNSLASLPQIKSGPSCDRCQDEDLGKPIAATISAADGSFVLRNVPAGVDFPLVVKIGKWRRVVTIPAVARCTNLDLLPDQSRLPKSMTDASPEHVAYVNIPRFAVATGRCDSMECVLRKAGVSDTEFTHPTGSGRIHLYKGRDGGGEMTPPSSTSFGGKADLFAQKAGGQQWLYDYDIAIFDCECSPGIVGYPNTDDPILRAWSNAGGRVFASHYGYAYLQDNGDFANSAVWTGASYGSVGIIDQTTSKGKAFNTWLGASGSWHPTYGDGYISLSGTDAVASAVNSGSERLVYTDTFVTPTGTTYTEGASVQTFGFNTPYGATASNVCGRVVYSAFHVTNSGSGQFPGYCSTAAMTAQEKVLWLALLDLSACVKVDGPGVPATCTPRTCAQMSATCGQVADGCGGLLDCGSCTAPDACGGGGIANQCGRSCTHTTCGAEGVNCGVIGDGCGGTINCSTCTWPAVCGGGGVANVCGAPACTPRSCSDVGATCGSISDGCGATVNCGTCNAPETCGGGGTPNQCGIGTCLPLTCGNAKCGFVGDGCGGTVGCGNCALGQTCVSGVCIGGTCTPRSCSAAEATCGFIGDGCGGVTDCGTCVPPLVCGGGGIPSQCGGNCTARSCAEAKAACGAISDGCGGIKECGVCPPGQTCGGGGVPNQCAAGACVPSSCTAAQAECGAIGDGCGGVLDCGPCPAPLTCGGGGVPNKCGAGGCVPLTCAQQKANCGPVADGCGGLLDCGPCPKGQTCGGDGIPSQCGGTILL